MPSSLAALCVNTFQVALLKLVESFSEQFKMLRQSVKFFFFFTFFLFLDPGFLPGFFLTFSSPSLLSFLVEEADVGVGLDVFEGVAFFLDGEGPA